jgi:hypothetical protein
MKISGILWKDIWEDEPIFRILDADHLARGTHITLMTLNAFLSKFFPSEEELKDMEGKLVTVEITQ